MILMNLNGESVERVYPVFQRTWVWLVVALGGVVLFSNFYIENSDLMAKQIRPITVEERIFVQSTLDELETELPELLFFTENFKYDFESRPCLIKDDQTDLTLVGWTQGKELWFSQEFFKLSPKARMKSLLPILLTQENSQQGLLARP